MSKCDYSDNREAAIRAAQNNGFENVNVVDEHHGFVETVGCSDSDSHAYEINATNVRNQRVSLIVCCGYQKACTIRSR